METTERNMPLMWYGVATVFADNCGTFSEHVWSSLLGREVARGSQCIENEQM